MSDNVTSMPSRRDRLAVEIKSWLTKEAANAKEWVEIKMGLCIALAAARADFPAHIEFGKWCEANGFGNKILNRTVKANAIAMGRDPVALRKCLEATDRRSLETIYLHEFSRYQSALITPTVTPSPKPAVAPPVAPQSAPAPAPAPTPQPTPTQPAPPPPVTAPALSPSAKERFDAALRAATKKIREELRVELYDEIKAKVSAEFDIRIKYFNDKIARADRILTSHKGVMSRADYRKILACLHPDHNKFASAAEALQLFSSLEKVLVKQDEPAITMPGPPMPKNAEEMMQWRKERERKSK